VVDRLKVQDGRAASPSPTALVRTPNFSCRPRGSRQVTGQLSETGPFCNSPPSLSAVPRECVHNPCPQSTSHNHRCHSVLRPSWPWDTCSATAASPLPTSNHISRSMPSSARLLPGFTETTGGARTHRPTSSTSSTSSDRRISALVERLRRLERCPLVPRSQPPDDPDRLLDALIDLVGQPPGDRPERHRPKGVARDETRGVLAPP
jgi:hypothetical protein